MNTLEWNYDEPITEEQLKECLMVVYWKEGFLNFLDRKTIDHKYIIKQTTDYPWMTIQPRYEEFSLTTISLRSKSTFFKKLSILNEKFGPTSTGGLTVERDPKDDEYLITTGYLAPKKHMIESLETAEYYDSLDLIAIIPEPLTLEAIKKRKEGEEPFRRVGLLPVHDDESLPETSEKYQVLYPSDLDEEEEEEEKSNDFITLDHLHKVVELENTNVDYADWQLTYEEIKMIYNRIIQVEKEAQ